MKTWLRIVCSRCSKRPIEMQPLSDLVKRAEAVAQQAYAPYSGFSVGAALLWTGAQITTGTNVENASYGLTICAERSAVCQAVALGCRHLQAAAIWVSGERMASPCGACLQVLLEFSREPAQVRIALAVASEVRVHTLAEFLPLPFRFQK